MNSYCIVQFVTLIAYLILIVIVIRHTSTRLKIPLINFLLMSAAWSLTSFLTHAEFTAAQSAFWFKFVSFFALGSVVAYSYFIATFVDKGTRIVGRVGLAVMSVVVVLIILGFIPGDNVGPTRGTLASDYGIWLYFLTLIGAIFTGTAIFLLVKSYLGSRSSEHRNRITYLLFGVALLVVFGILFEILPKQAYAVDHIGHLGNAAVITYAILRYRLFDIKLVIRRGLAYSSIAAFITAVYLVVLVSIYRLLEGLAGGLGLVPVIILSVLMAWLFNPIRTMIEKGVDRLFYGKRYNYRETVLNLARLISNVIELEELADHILKPITKAVRASQASILLLQENEFVTSFAERLVEGEPVIPMRLPKDSPIVTWLIRENKPLTKETIDINVEFKALWDVERRALAAAEIELLCPIMSKDKLVGILGLAKKNQQGFYSKDDIDLLMTVAPEVAMAIENAQLYTQARERANIDELTGLFNHRFFHQRLDEEIARASRFGQIFSLLMLDLDFFKTYNDVHGHLAGDDVLKDVARHIKLATRRMDIGVRYGGDEFAIILPQTSIEAAHAIAERLHSRIESQIETQGVPLTCSIGIASWPADGIMRGKIVRLADAALYHAKQIGGGRICLASDITLVQASQMEIKPEAKAAILSTIYALAATVDAKDHYTYGHSKKVARYATEIARKLGYSEDKIATIRVAALLHDIGKIGISDHLLEKPGPLTEEEWEPVRAHPDLGVMILKHVDGLHDCLPGVQYHHEHYDGMGYPSGLKGDNIPMDARIMAVADAYDAMTSLRPYRRGKATHEQGLAELQRYAGTQFDPVVVEAFTSLELEPAGKVTELEKDIATFLLSP